MTDRSPLVSVVTPFYNSERDLARCIESVLAQDHPSFEYVLVDNQSTDGSSEIARTYAEKDARIRLITTDRFLSQVENYNFALTQISDESRWVKICQADDWLYPRCLVEMVALGEASPTVGLVSSYSWRGEQLLCLGLPHDVSVLSGHDACRLHLLTDLFLFGSPTTVLYRADLVRARSPFYELGRLHEDTEVCFELLRDSDFGFVHQVLSYRSIDQESISGRESDLLSSELDRLIILTRFGADHLTPADLSHRHGELSSTYQRRLGQRILRGMATGTMKGLVDYQRHALSSVGLALSHVDILRAVGVALACSATAPVATVRILKSKRRREERVSPGRDGPSR
jgi:glycosyltransferase involved in cell wall biosynthesis